MKQIVKDCLDLPAQEFAMQHHLELLQQPSPLVELIHCTASVLGLCSIEQIATHVTIYLSLMQKSKSIHRFGPSEIILAYNKKTI